MGLGGGCIFAIAPPPGYGPVSGKALKGTVMYQALKYLYMAFNHDYYHYQYY